jgi:hypothetical protein
VSFRRLTIGGADPFLEVAGEVLVLGGADLADIRLGAPLPAGLGRLVEEILEQRVADQVAGAQGGYEVQVVEVVAELDPGLRVVEPAGDGAVADEPAHVAGVLGLVGVEQRDHGAQLPRLLRLLAGHDGSPDGDGRRGRRDHGRDDRQADRAAVAHEHVLNPRRPQSIPLTDSGGLRQRDGP